MLTPLEARIIASRAMADKPVSGAMVDMIYKNIEASARAGGFSVENPWEGPGVPKSSEAQRQALIQMLISQGYKVTRHTIGLYPAEPPYTVVAW